jgi:hypothetical protein
MNLYLDVTLHLYYILNKLNLLVCIHAKGSAAQYLQCLKLQFKHIERAY